MDHAVRSTWRRLSRKHPRQLLQMAARRLAERTGAAELDVPLRDSDVWDSGRPLRPAAPIPDEASLRIGWIAVPPTPGSGGHTTFFRMLDAARRAGHRNTLLLYDRYNGDFATQVDRVRRGWPWLACEIREAPRVLTGFDVLVASAWPTAHVLASRSADVPVARFAFLQDYEPDFYPQGALHALAEDSYRFGVTNVALGPMVARRLREELGVDSRVVPYGTDRVTYRPPGRAVPREGVVFFAKANNDRRGYRLGVLALREFQRREPAVPLHVYGDRMREPGLRVVNHGYLSPPQLNALYGGAKAGLVLSFTNVSLIPAELAAAGVIPVLNDFAGAREVIDNPHVSWAPPRPLALARALEAAVADADPSRPAALAGWSTPSWDDTAREFLGLILSGTR